ncbi:UNVERIFIED_CONTAM: hypothetical protein FKN15_017155, partial [Acipenser sinensis]
GPSEVSASVRYRRRPTCPDASVAASLPTPPVARHRKSHSLGNNVMCQLSVAESKSATFPTEKPRHLLDDSLLESHSPARNLSQNRVFSNGMSLGSSESSFSEELSSGVKSPTGACPSRLSGSGMGGIAIEGPLRRKTLLKEGKKPALSSWSRYWITLSGSTLQYYGSKALRATERKHYKSTPCKKVLVIGWMVVLPDDPEHPDIFQLNDPDKGNVYKFQTGSRFHAILWHKHLEDACKSGRPQFMGKWYSHGLASTCPWLIARKSKMSMSTLVLNPSNERGQVDATVTFTANGQCTEKTAVYRETETPGHMKYHISRRNADVDVDVYVVRTNYDEYAMVLMLKQMAGKLTKTAKLYGRTQELRPSLLAEFKQFALEQGFGEDTFQILPKTEECQPSEIREEPVLLRALFCLHNTKAPGTLLGFDTVTLRRATRSSLRTLLQHLPGYQQMSNLPAFSCKGIGVTECENGAHSAA